MRDAQFRTAKLIEKKLMRMESMYAGSLTPVQGKATIHPLQTRFLFQEFGKSSKFSDSFNNNMYQDNSLWAATRLNQRLNQGR